jgi:type II secretory pathway component PulF
VIAEEEADAEAKQTVQRLHDGIEEGASLSEAMDRCDGVFSLSARTLVRTAERTGAWEEILAELADGLADGTFE